MANEINRFKKTNTQVPKTLGQADLKLLKIGGLQDQITAIEKELAEKIAVLRAKAAKKVQPLTVKRDNAINALFAFADPRKAELTKKYRSVILGFGTFGWRLTPARVEVAGSVEEVIVKLKKIKKGPYVRVIEEIDRQALLADRPEIPGISYKQNDEFFVVPVQVAKRPKTFTRAIDREEG